MSTMELLGALEAEKLTKEKCKQYYGTPCMKDITFLNTIHKVKIGFKPSFSSKIADLAENVRLKRPEKEAIVSCSEINHSHVC